MTPYQEFIAKSRYARYLPDEARREDWPETAQRWINFFKAQYPQAPAWVWPDLQSAILNLDALPSMRSVMTAGPALERTHVSAYNCSYLPVDHPRSFDEAMYILLCGTGVGFSVESRYVDQLPSVPTLTDGDKVILVGDSKEGWCYAYQELLAALWDGRVLRWDVSQVRPAGAPLKTFGGRASGPGPLVDLFEYTVAKFKDAAGRKLSTLECHDIMCKIGEVVVVGGVRRSAMISLGDLNDEQHATAKTAEWWKDHPERALSNNSAIYEGAISREIFDNEWALVRASGSGERGIINRTALQAQASRYGLRAGDADYGTNPCAEIILKPYQFCNLSTTVIRAGDSPTDIKRKVALATIFGTMQSGLTDFGYLRPIWKENTEAENLLGVSMTGIYSNWHLTGLNPNHREFRRQLRELARLVNGKWAARLGLKPSSAVTCVKPEGTVSQLALTESGLHPGHAEYYIRRVRQDRKDPLTQFMIDQGVPYEADVMKPNDTVVFSFPMNSKGVVRKDITAIDHLELWLSFQEDYCEHKPSVTISIKEHEWQEVGDWLFKNFDKCTGVSVLPDDGGTYQQAPYEEIDKQTYDKLLAEMPHLDWSKFREEKDTVQGAQLLACSSGICEINL
jgi:ribonucleoside-triphosphate reductase (thioredoxin)